MNAATEKPVTVIRVWANGERSYLADDRAGLYFSGPDYLPTPDHAAVMAAIEAGRLCGNTLGGNVRPVPCVWHLVSRGGVLAPKLTADHEAYRAALRAELASQRQLSAHGGAGGMVASLHGFPSLSALDRYLAGEDIELWRVPSQYLHVA